MKLANSLVYIYLILFSFINSFPTKRRLENTLTFNTSNWSYDQTNNVYHQIGVTYCQNPASTTYETLGIYVPGEYMSCTQGTSTYTCTINSSGSKGSYTAKNAPFVMPVNTSGYSAMKAPTSYSYSTVSSFIEKGIIYIYAGCRGRYEGSETDDSYYMGAPWGVTDLKAAIRFLRYNSASIPGDLNKFYTFGHSGGGAQSCLMGITGNSDLFKDYLNNIGAAMNLPNGTEIKDNIKGSQCWCPITNLDTADAAYEWNMGQYANTSTRASGTFTKALSDDLVSEYVKYVNDIKLKDPKGNELTLTSTNEGTYYNYLKSVIEESLNNFLNDTTFPYTPSSSSSKGGPGGNPQGSGVAPSGSAPIPSGSGAAPTGSGTPPEQRAIRNLDTNTTYQTKDDYINYLNSDVEWITKDSNTGNYTIKSVGDFVSHCKSASKDVGAFDDLSKSQAENQLFGISHSTYANHFDKIMATLLNNNSSTYSSLDNWNSSYPTEYNDDLTVNDILNKSVEYRVNMYNPMYYIHPYYEGYNTSNVADYFRINTGITQGDTSNVVEMNLFLALTNFGKNAKFTTVWNQGHTEAERSGSATDNFISWIAEIEGVNNTKGDDSHNSDSTTSSYDYSSYNATSINTNLTNQVVLSNTSGQSAVYITLDGINIKDSNITKSGDISSSNTEDSEFYGINAAILVQGGGLTMTGGNITTSARGGNALVATNGGTVIISGTNITSTGSGSARGLHATYKGNITANNVTISSTGGSCATLATDRGEGTVSCTNCTLSTSGSGSPLIYSTGSITVTNTTGTSSGAQMVVVEGKNSATIKSSKLNCTASPNNNRNDGCGALIYQSQSGDADSGTSYFTCDKSSLEIVNTSNYYNSAPMLYITNTAANISLTGCDFNYGSKKFLVANEGDWGSSGSNGGNVSLTLTNQIINGDFVVGNSSTLNMELINSTINGTINGNKTASKLAITLDSNSKIYLTGNSYYTSLNNAVKDGSNINTGNYIWGDYNTTSTSNTSNNENYNENNSVILLGFSDFNKTHNSTHFSFFIYFIRLLQSLSYRKLRFPVKIDYQRLLRSLQETQINVDCTLEETESENQMKYSCQAPADTSRINNIKVVPEFTFDDKNISLAGITPLANMYMEKLQDVKDELKNIDNIYVLEHSIQNKYDKYLFNITGIIDDKPNYYEKDLTLTVNTTSSGNKNICCTITNTISNNYNLNCKPKDNIDFDLQSSYSIINNDMLIINFDNKIEAIVNATESNSTLFYTNEKSGISAGGIVAIILCTIVAVGAVFAIIFFLKGQAPKKPDLIDTAEHISKTQAVSETNLN